MEGMDLIQATEVTLATEGLVEVTKIIKIIKVSTCSFPNNFPINSLLQKESFSNLWTQSPEYVIIFKSYHILNFTITRSN